MHSFETAIFTRLALATSFIGLVAGQSASASASALSASVTQIFYPFADQQPLVASLIAQDGDVKTIAMECAPDADLSECGFPTTITLTVGPSTLRHNPTGIWEALGVIDCKVTSSFAAECTNIGGFYDDTTSWGGEYVTTPAASSWTESAILTGTELNWLDVTITAGLVSGSSAAMTTATGSGGSAVTSTLTSGSAFATGHNGGSGIGSTSGATGSSTADVAATTGNGAARTLRVTYTGLAAALVAGSMMLL